MHKHDELLYWSCYVTVPKSLFNKVHEQENTLICAKDWECPASQFAFLLEAVKHFLTLPWTLVLQYR